MKEIRIVDAENIETLEDYAVSLLAGMISLKSLDHYHATAFKKGLLKDDEVKNAESINHNIMSLLRIYKSQVENVLERTELTEEEILLKLMKIMPDIKIPRKRKNVKKKKDEQIESK